MRDYMRHDSCEYNRVRRGYLFYSYSALKSGDYNVACHSGMLKKHFLHNAEKLKSKLLCKKIRLFTEILTNMKSRLEKFHSFYLHE